MGKADTESAHRNNRTTCLPFSQEVYDACIKNPIDFRIYVDNQVELFPELFPVGIDKGCRRTIFARRLSSVQNCYDAENKTIFSQRIRRLVEWCKKNNMPPVIANPINKLHQNIAAYKVAYDHPKAHRTSNMVDRLMQRMDLCTSASLGGYRSRPQNPV